MKLARSKMVSFQLLASNNWRREILRVPTALSFPPSSFWLSAPLFSSKKSCFHHHWKNSDRKRGRSIMSSAAAFISGPSSAAHLRKSKKGASFQQYKTHFISRGALKASPSSSLLLIRKASSNGHRRSPDFTHSRPFSPVTMQWQDCRAEIEIDVPASVAYDCYSDCERIPEWMPFISSVKVLKDNPDLACCSLKYEVLGRNVEFSWLTRNMQPIRNQKLHWRSLEGLPNNGAVRFFPKGPSLCRIELTISYVVPEILSPVALVLKPFMEGVLFRSLERFAMVAKNYNKEAPQS